VSGRWYARPVFAVAQASRALAFYVDRLGFHEDWRHEEAGALRIVQVSRGDCELILSDQWPDQAGRGLMFISLDAAALTAARQQFLDRGVDVTAGWWGYELMVVEDPDGNRLWFPHPGEG